jgi:hypothetical protein
MKQLAYCLSTIIIITLAACKGLEEVTKKECSYIVLDWPEEIAKCITPAEEKGLRDSTKWWKDVWERMKNDCPNVKKVDDGSALYSLYVYPDAILVSGKVDMMNKLKERTQKDSCCIRKLKMRGHGNFGLIIIGSGRVKRNCKYINGHPGSIEYNADDWKKDLHELKGLLCDSAEIALEGCNVGNGKIGEFKLQEIAKEFGATVSAPKRFINAREKIENFDPKDVCRVTPPAPVMLPPAGEQEKTNKQLKEEKKKHKIGKAVKPIKKKVAAIGFYPALYEPLPDLASSPSLPITDPEWIHLFITEIDTNDAYDANLELYAVDATVILKYDDGTYDAAYTIYGSSMFGIDVEELGDMQFLLSEKGTQMALEAMSKSSATKH